MKTEQYRAGGMDAPVSIDMGLEAMEAKFSTNGARRSTEFLRPGRPERFQWRVPRLLQGPEGRQRASGGYPARPAQEVDPGDWKAGESRVQVRRCGQLLKLEVDGREVYEIDPVNGVRAINGVDQLAGMRNDLGL